MNRFYLSNKNSYLFSQYHQISHPTGTTLQTQPKIEWLKQMHFTLKLLNLYLSVDSTSSLILQSSDTAGFLTSEPNFWYYLVLNGLVLNELEVSSILKSGGDANYELTMNLIHSVNQQFRQILNETSFLSSILNSLGGWNQFIFFFKKLLNYKMSID